MTDPTAKAEQEPVLTPARLDEIRRNGGPILRHELLALVAGYELSRRSAPAAKAQDGEEPALLTELRELRAKATVGPWGVWEQECGSFGEIRRELLEQLDATPQPGMSLFMLNSPAGNTPAITGNGTHSEANAHLICSLVNAYDSGLFDRKAPSPAKDRPLQLRGKVADLMVDELAKQYQKASVYGSLAQKWSDRARQLGATKDRFDADGRTDEESLAFARGALENAAQQEEEPAKEPECQQSGGGCIHIAGHPGPCEFREAAIRAPAKEPSELADRIEHLVKLGYTTELNGLRRVEKERDRLSAALVEIHDELCRKGQPPDHDFRGCAIDRILSDQEHVEELTAALATSEAALKDRTSELEAERAKADVVYANLTTAIARWNETPNADGHYLSGCIRRAIDALQPANPPKVEPTPGPPPEPNGDGRVVSDDDPSEDLPLGRYDGI